MENELNETVRNVLVSEVTPVFLKLLQESEERIGETNKMIQTLSNTCARNLEMYDKHLAALEASRDRAQMNSAGNIDLCKSLTKMLEECRAELRDAKNDYRRLSEAYTRLAESGSGQSKSSVKVNI